MIIIKVLVVCLFLPAVIGLWYLLKTEQPKGPKGEVLTDDVIDAYKEQDQLDKESVFDHCK